MSQIQIPKGWELKEVVDVIELAYGKNLPKPLRNSSGKFPVYGSNGIVGYHDKFFVDYPSIIIGRKGTVGAINLAEAKFWPTDVTFYVKIKEPKKINFKFVYYLLLHLNLPNYRQSGPKSGLNRNDVYNIEFLLPPPSIQKKIVKKLDYILDQFEEKNKQILYLLSKFDSKKINKNYKNHLLKLAFDGTYTNEQSVEINGIKVPNGWTFLTLPQIVKNEKYAIKRGPFGSSLKKEIFKDKGYLVYEQYHAINDDFSMARYFIDEKKFNEMKHFKVTSGDMIISCSGVTLGRIAEIPENALEGIINQALLKISLDTQIINPTYFKFLFRSDMIQKTLFKISRGTGMPNFPSMKEIKSILFPIPPMETQKKIVQILEKKFAKWENHKQEIENIEKRHIAIKKHCSDLLSSILTDAFSGKLVN